MLSGTDTGMYHPLSRYIPLYVFWPAHGPTIRNTHTHSLFSTFLHAHDGSLWNMPDPSSTRKDTIDTIVPIAMLLIPAAKVVGPLYLGLHNQATTDR